MNKPSTQHIAAFTIFEITVVLAVMSVLITIISASMNRFNEQLKVATEVHAELNHWRAVRSVIWSDFYAADSIRLTVGELTLFSEEHSTLYKIQDDQLHRSLDNISVNLEVEAESIYAEEKAGTNSYHMTFPWKGGTMDLNYHFQAGIDIKMNAYFDNLH